MLQGFRGDSIKTQWKQDFGLKIPWIKCVILFLKLLMQLHFNGKNNTEQLSTTVFE